jgi:hypothetical protein
MSKEKGSITLSPKHGVNPSILHCECCGKEYGIGLAGKLKGDAEAPKDVMYGFCDDCQKVINAEGLMIIEVRDGETGKNPYRTGRLIGITKDAKERMFKGINSPICYMEQSMFNAIFGKVEFKQ